MITDVEMLNMDGFMYIDRVRQANIDIPILVVSSRASEEWAKKPAAWELVTTSIRVLLLLNYFKKLIHS